jgi:hypothetical protein
MTGLEGGCACGQVRYRLNDKPMFVNCCHCHDCQRQTGTAFVINALIEADRVEVTGETRFTRMPTDSGSPHDVYRCTSCQTALWSHYGGRNAVSFVRVGTLDDPTAVRPDAHIFTRSKLPWVDLSGETEVHEIFYSFKDTWPPESLARQKAALAG